MKLLHIACLAGLLWLSGCATQVGAPSAPSAASTDSAVPTATTPSTPEASHTPQIPSGPLLPIAPARASRLEVMPLFTPSDLWDRIRRGFAMPDLQNDLVQDREQWYANRPDYMQRMTERSRKYLFHIVEELERRDMPTELALLPFIESAFNPHAVSTAKAAGMWQFMPATGNYFDLKQNAFRDDRRDVLASTRAALDYLQKLYGMFGDWHLALAAYNWGEGSVSRAIARNQKAGLGTSYTDLTMPGETRLYVPKLQAVKNIVANPEAFRTDLPLIENHPYFQTVDITRDIDVALAARLADVDLADFKALNPSLDKPVILAAGTPQILLPWDNAKVFERNLAAYKEGQYASWTVWTLPSTMSTAEVARRVGMDETELRTINRIPPRMLVKAGSALIVPRSIATRTDVGLHVADNGKLSLTPEVVTRRSVVRARKGDTVASLSKRHRVSPSNLAQWNSVKPSASFKAGQEVVLMLPVRMQASRDSRDSRDTKASAGKRTARKGSAPVKRESKSSRKKRR